MIRAGIPSRIERIHFTEGQWVAPGAGAESRRPIGWVIVGGLLLGTLLTLFVIPTAYTLLVGKRKLAAGEEGHPSPEAATTT